MIIVSPHHIGEDIGERHVIRVERALAAQQRQPAAIYLREHFDQQVYRYKLLGTQQLQRGDTVGYGSRFTAEGPLLIGVAACGYADGYPRHASTGTPICVDGVMTRTLGRISMDMLGVDLDPVPGAAVGSEVVVWGEGGPSVDDVARASGTVGYELLCALAPRVPVQVHTE